MKKVLLIIHLIFFYCISCAPPVIQWAAEPRQPYKSYRSSYNTVWKNVNKVIADHYSQPITKDSLSGVIVFESYYTRGRNLYTFCNQVYVKEDEGSPNTTVYLFSRTKYGTFLKSVENDFFNKLDGSF